MYEEKLRQAIWLGLLMLCAGQAQALSATKGTNPAVEQAGDMLQVGIPVVAFGLTFLMGGEDPEDSSARYTGAGLSLDTSWLRMNGSPRHDLALALARTEIVTYGLKYGINAERPSGGGQSFPSGHTSVAFAGAEFIRKEYGWGWGIPFYAAASYVGWSRVESRAHWERDVIAGAAIGIFSNHDVLSFSMPFGQLQVAPTIMLSSGAASPDRSGFASRRTLAEPRVALSPGLQFELRF